MNTTSSESLFVCTCQECGHKSLQAIQQVANKPVYGSELRLAYYQYNQYNQYKQYKNETLNYNQYSNANCRKRKSEALDYGSEDFTRNADGKLVKI